MGADTCVGPEELTVGMVGATLAVVGKRMCEFMCWESAACGVIRDMESVQPDRLDECDMEGYVSWSWCWEIMEGP